MASVRIKHATDTNCVRLTPLLGQPMPHPRQLCNLCRVVHEFKVFHISIEPDGTAIVTKGIWDVLNEIPAGFGMDAADGYSLEHEVKNPPPINLGRARELEDQKNRAGVLYHTQIKET